MVGKSSPPLTRIEKTFFFFALIVIVTAYIGCLTESDKNYNEVRDRVTCTSRITRQTQTLLVRRTLLIKHNEVCFINLNNTETCIMGQECTVQRWIRPGRQRRGH